MAPNDTPKPIAKGNSTKANPDILSFLDLPAEIRNQIYGILFTKGAVDSQAHELHNCDLGPWYSPSTSSTSIRLWKMGDDRVSFQKDGCHIDGIQSTRAQFLGGRALLSTCRQAYHEAVTTFLKSNTWTIASGCSSSRHQICTLLQCAAIFLSALGSQSGLLESLKIDMVGTWSPTCQGSLYHRNAQDPYLDLSTTIKFKDLVKELHKPSNNAIDVEIVFGTPSNQAGCLSTTLANSGLDLFRLNKLLRLLVQDPLGFLEYGHAVHEILIDRDGRTGGIFFDRSFIDSTHKQYFRVSENGDAITLIPPSKLDHILKLPRNIRSEIIKHVTQCGSPRSYRKTITFDLDKGTCEDGSTVLASVCRELRGESFSQFQLTNKWIAKMASKDKRTNFDDFRKLEKFWCIGRSAQFPWRGRELYTLQHFDCLLEVEAATTPESVRINITDFLRITSTIGNKKGNLTISATRGQDVAPSNTSTSFEELRWYVLIALTEFIRKHPDANHRLCPNIWINGLGQVVEIESADTTMDPQAYIPKYTPWSTHRRTIFREYGLLLKGHTYWHDVDGYTPPAEAFDGSARFYISWLQRCGLGVSPKYWSDVCELFWVLLVTREYADCCSFPDSGCLG